MRNHWGRVKCEARAQLNLTRQPKGKKTTPKVMDLGGKSSMLQMVWHVCQTLEQRSKEECCRGFRLCKSSGVWSPKTAASDSTSDMTCETRKMAGCFNALPRQVFPEGLMSSSCRTDMSNTLAQNCISNWWGGAYPTCKPTKSPGTEKELIQNDRHAGSWLSRP